MPVGGWVASGYEAVRDAFERAHHDDPGGSQLCVYRRGERIVDLWIGSDMSTTRAETGDTLHVLMSTTKGALAVIAAMLIERGLLDVDAPVREYWPEYAVAGKENTTAAHFLTHTAGLAVFRAASRITAADMPDWEKCTRALAEAEPLWEPGSALGYHGITYGFLVGEVIRRVTGRSAGRFLAEEIAAPLGLDFWIGLPADRAGQVTFQAPRTSADFGDPPPPGSPPVEDPAIAEYIESWGNLGRRFFDGFLNSTAGQACELGAVNGIANARSVAKMYAATIGEVDGVRLLSADGLAFALQPRTTGLPHWGPEFGDAVAHGLGFQRYHPFGNRGKASTFGHDGAGGVQGFASVELGVAVGYTCSAMNNVHTLDPRHGFWDALVEAGLA
jgi:CubicO group peptidase (beta-lactamase class C family)